MPGLSTDAIDLMGQVIEGAKITYESAKKIEEDYKVSEKVNPAPPPTALPQ